MVFSIFIGDLKLKCAKISPKANLYITKIRHIIRNLPEQVTQE
ncbi:hypothetical protein NOC27_2316 [Nitrosococcus oceani AFC27]|nr:hypothetical protein NOC27_2316 [Nitrosococcus oceani AFC27]